MTQIVVKDETIERLEKISGKKFSRGGDRLINEVINKLEDCIHAANH